MTYDIMKSGERKICIELAAKAFENYDFFSVYVPDDRRRPRFLHSMLGVEFKVNTGLVHFLTAKENDRIVAAAMVRAPGYRMPSVRKYLMSGFWKNIVIGGWNNVAAWFDMDQKAGLPCQSLGGNTWFLHLLAVDTSSEGKGIGSRMLNEGIIPFVKDRSGETLSLYTNSEINRKFYVKNGFKEFHSQQFSYGGKSFGSWSYKMDLNGIR